MLFIALPEMSCLDEKQRTVALERQSKKAKRQPDKPGEIFILQYAILLMLISGGIDKSVIEIRNKVEYVSGADCYAVGWRVCTSNLYFNKRGD